MIKRTFAHASGNDVKKITGEKPNASLIASTSVAAKRKARSKIHPATAE
jgi:hypothetical protein